MTTNKLVNGLIPVGQPCPYQHRCKHISARCPKDRDLKNIAMSCGMARLFEMGEKISNKEAEH